MLTFFYPFFLVSSFLEVKKTTASQRSGRCRWHQSRTSWTRFVTPWSLGQVATSRIEESLCEISVSVRSCRKNYEIGIITVILRYTLPIVYSISGDVSNSSRLLTFCFLSCVQFVTNVTNEGDMIYVTPLYYICMSIYP